MASHHHSCEVPCHSMSHNCTNCRVLHHGSPSTSVSPGGTHGICQLHPRIEFKKLPFYEVMAELLKPSCLLPNGNERLKENTFYFQLTHQQARDLAEARRASTETDIKVQILFRICLLNRTVIQDDHIPGIFFLEVNKRMHLLPVDYLESKLGVDSKRLPVNITRLCQFSESFSNSVTITWGSEYGKDYAVGVYLVRRLNPEAVLTRLKASGIGNPDHTRAIIKQKYQEEPGSDIVPTSFRGSLMCPLGKIKMQVPCHAVTCSHLQCFDALTYIQVNEKRPTWMCPVCQKPATLESLAIDGLFLEILKKAPEQCTEVQFHEDGTWTPILNGIDDSVSRPSLQDSPGKESVVDLSADSDSDDSSSDAASPRHTSSPQSHCSSHSYQRSPSPSSLPSTHSCSPPPLPNQYCMPMHQNMSSMENPRPVYNAPISSSSGRDFNSEIHVPNTCFCHGHGFHGPVCQNAPPFNPAQPFFFHAIPTPYEEYHLHDRTQIPSFPIYCIIHGAEAPDPPPEVITLD